MSTSAGVLPQEGYRGQPGEIRPCEIYDIGLWLGKLLLERYIMAYKIEDDCVNCGACDPECAVEAIIEKDGRRWIDPDKCVDCGACVPVCPVDCIKEG
jgi:NAD-dependent dihydropyrimidine dehydrogenase PreA subunit